MAKVNIDIAVNERGAKKKIDNITKSTKQATQGFDKLSVSVKQSGSAFSSFIGNVAAIGFTNLISGLSSFAASSVKVTGEIETLNTQFEVLTGSVGLANKAVQDLQEFAASTPFQFKDLAKAEQRLLSFGFSLEETQDRMKDIGDVAAASGADISELALIFGQVRAASKLTGERLLQFQERAIPIGPALAKTMGVAESAIKDLVSEGKVDFATFEKAFQSLNDNGEFAFEGMIKRSRTLEGRISTLKDNFELLQANVGGKLAPAFKALTSTVTIFIQKLQDSQGFKDFIKTISDNIPSAINIAINSLSFIINSVFNVIKAFNLFRSGVATAIARVIDALTVFVDAYVKVADVLGIGDGVLGKSLKTFQTFRDDVVSSLDDTAAGFAKSAAEISLNQEAVNNAIERGRDIIVKAYDDELAAAKAQSEGTIETQTKKVESVKSLTSEEIEALKKLKEAKQELQLAEEESRLLELGNNQIFNEEKLIQLQDFFTAEQEAAIQAKINLVDNEVEKQTLITQAQSEAIKNRKKLQDEELKDLRKAEQDYTKFKETEAKLREDNQRGTLSRIATLSQSNNKELAAIGKAAGVAQIAIDTPVAVAKAIAAFPPPFGFIAGGLVGTAMAAQAAKLAGVNFEQGGIVPGSSFTGDNVQANVNSGEMILNRQQQSQLFSLATGQNQQQSNGQPMNITVQSVLDGEVISETVSQWVANGGQLGEVQ